MCKNIFPLVLGVILGAMLGILICDEKKKKLLELLQCKRQSLCHDNDSACQITPHED